jgi:hypothetical protein
MDHTTRFWAGHRRPALAVGGTFLQVKPLQESMMPDHRPRIPDPMFWERASVAVATPCSARTPCCAPDRDRGADAGGGEEDDPEDPPQCG